MITLWSDKYFLMFPVLSQILNPELLIESASHIAFRKTVYLCAGVSQCNVPINVNPDRQAGEGAGKG